MLKCCASKSLPEGESKVAINLIYELLNALIAKPVELPEEGMIYLFYFYFTLLYALFHCISLKVLLILKNIHINFHTCLASSSDTNSEAPSTSDQQSPLRDINNGDLISTDDDDGLVSSFYFYIFFA